MFIIPYVHVSKACKVPITSSVLVAEKPYAQRIFAAWMGSLRDFPFSKSSTPAADSLLSIQLNQTCQQKLVQPWLKAHGPVADISFDCTKVSIIFLKCIWSKMQIHRIKIEHKLNKKKGLSERSFKFKDNFFEDLQTVKRKLCI